MCPFLLATPRSRDQCMKATLSAIAVLLVIQYSFNVALTRKYRKYQYLREYQDYRHNSVDGRGGGGTGGTGGSGIEESGGMGGNVLRWLLAHHVEESQPPPPTPIPTLPPCSDVPPSLDGRNITTGIIPVFFEAPSWPELEAAQPQLLSGGEWKPRNCTSRYRIGVVVPYRDREEHLRVFLNHMHSYLQRQEVHYTILVIEQVGTDLFSRSTLMNVGFTEALKLDKYNCFFFHDVDLLPESDFNLYRCPEQPRHMSAAVDTMAYRLPYPTIFGGVSAMTVEQFKNVNGFSNLFFGWGGEDDDMYNRISSHGYKVIRYPMAVARYRMIRHLQDQPSNDRFKNLYEGSQRFSIDGLNSLMYNVTSIEKYPLFTRIKVFLNRTEIIQSHEKRMRALRLENLKKRLHSGYFSSTPDPNSKWIGAVNSLGDVLDHKPEILRTKNSHVGQREKEKAHKEESERLYKSKGTKLPPYSVFEENKNLNKVHKKYKKQTKKRDVYEAETDRIRNSAKIKDKQKQKYMMDKQIKIDKHRQRDKPNPGSNDPNVKSALIQIETVRKNVQAVHNTSKDTDWLKLVESYVERTSKDKNKVIDTVTRDLSNTKTNIKMDSSTTANSKRYIRDKENRVIEIDTLDIGATEIDIELKRIEKGLQRKPLDKQNKQTVT